jgi:cob(I)alamin adenosyltransferase
VEQGFLQVYTGDGKGKTTAALGLALRAVGAGLRVHIAQFVKGMHYSELESIGRLGQLITIKQHGRSCFIDRQPQQADIDAAREGLEQVKKILAAGECDLLVLDEANIATHYNLFSVDELLAVIDSRPPGVEIVITGRRADPRIIERADLVTEMKEVKHYYATGVQARKGIEK